MTFLDGMTMLCRDLTIIANTIFVGHLSRSVFLSHLTKEMASLLLDQTFTHTSSLRRRFTIHGVETISENSGIFEKPSSLDGSIANLAEQIGCYRIFRKGPRTMVKSLSPPRSLKNLVADEFLYTEEARLLGKLTLSEKNTLAGHRNRKMTMESFETLTQMTLFSFGKINEALLMKDDLKTGWAIDKACECTDELVKKVDYYPTQTRKVKAKLDMYPSIATSMLASDIQEDQGGFDEHIKIATVVKRGVHLLRSILRERGIYHRRSKSVLIEDHRFRRAAQSCNTAPPGIELTDDPLLLTDYLSALLEGRENRKLICIGQTA